MDQALVDPFVGPDERVPAKPGALPRLTLHGFWESEPARRMLESVAADRRLARAQVRLHADGLAAAIAHYGRAASPDVLVVETSGAVRGLLHRLDELAEVCMQDTRLVLLGGENDVSLYRDLLSRGVSDYIVLPAEPAAVIDSLAALFRRSESVSGRRLAFIGAKGGVGSSTIALGVATALARAQTGAVILVDLDLHFGGVDSGNEIEPGKSTAQALREIDRLDHVLLDRLLTGSERNLSLLAASGLLEDAWEFGGDQVERLLEVADKAAAHVVLDVPHVWAPWSQQVLLSADEIVVVAAPDLANLRNAKNLVRKLGQARPNDPPPRLVLNQVGMPRRAEIDVAKFSAVLQTRPVARLPFDAALTSLAANSGKAVADVGARTALARGLAQVAMAVSGARSPAPRPRRLLPSFRLWKRS